MIPVKFNQNLKVTQYPQNFSLVPVETDHAPEQHYLSALSPEKPWALRKSAAQKLSKMRSQEALDGLIAALPSDPFWMVRCTIIQALERIGDPAALPVLLDAASHDQFKVVRAYAAKAVMRLSEIN